ncbi:hypothetical protein HPB48_001611 [Haemaphysalis longicornis]|uniref:DUF4371 domain-containing protein n=1 Tax=Haemaphysalis longicornis TaxID=44386 RepID=A0A9J6FCA2_HAELO|nr:hypothetical protein HPB48_001611 [Haemaphysalis longicornis]
MNFSSFANERNFRDLLRFRIESGDKELAEHLTRSSRRETYISKTIQNELISCCGTEISSIITERAKTAVLYSIMFDDTTDIAHESQLALVLRYVHNGVLREDFLEFISLRRSSAEHSETMNHSVHEPNHYR